MLIPLLRTYLAPYKRPIALVLTFQLVQTLANLWLPGLNADIIDKGVVQGDTGYIVRTGGMMLMVTVIQVVCTIVAVYFGARTAMALGRDLRAGVFSKVETFAAREMAQLGAPTLITRSTNDVQQVQLIVFLALTLLVAAPIMCFGGIFMALRQDVELSGLLLLVLPALIISIGLVIRQMRPLFRVMQVKIDGINGIMREQIMGIRVIRAFVKERYEAKRFGDANRETMEVAIAVGRLTSMMFPIVMLIMNVSVVLATWFGGYRIGSGELQVGTLTAFQNYLVQILMSVMMATFMLMLWPRAEVAAERITEVLDTEPSVVAPDDAVQVTLDRGQLDIQGASFASPGPSTTSCTRSTSWRGRARPRRSSAHGQRQVDVAGLIPGCSTPRPAQSVSTVTTYVPCIPRMSGRRSVSCRSDRSSSAAPWRRTCATAVLTPRKTSCGRRSRSRRPRASSSACPSSSTPRSPRAAPTSPAGSASGWRSPGPSSSGPRSTCSTTRSRRSTMRRMPRCAPRCVRPPPRRPS